MDHILLYFSDILFLLLHISYGFSCSGIRGGFDLHAAAFIFHPSEARHIDFAVLLFTAFWGAGLCTWLCLFGCVFRRFARVGQSLFICHLWRCGGRCFPRSFGLFSVWCVVLRGRIRACTLSSGAAVLRGSIISGHCNGGRGNLGSCRIGILCHSRRCRGMVDISEIVNQSACKTQARLQNFCLYYRGIGVYFEG